MDTMRSINAREPAECGGALLSIPINSLLLTASDDAIVWTASRSSRRQTEDPRLQFTQSLSFRCLECWTLRWHFLKVPKDFH